MAACDYMYLTDRGSLSRDELTGEERASATCVMVAKCGATRCLFAHTVPRKGVDDEGYIVDRLRKDIAWLGHSKAMLRSDNKPAILG